MERNNKKSSHQGSIVVVLLLLMSVMTLLLGAALRESTFLRMLLNKYGSYERSEIWGHSLLRYAIGQAKKNYEELMKHDYTTVLEIKDENFTGALHVMVDQNKLLVVARVLEADRELFKRGCHIESISENNFITHSFQNDSFPL